MRRRITSPAWVLALGLFMLPAHRAWPGVPALPNLRAIGPTQASIAVDTDDGGGGRALRLGIYVVNGGEAPLEIRGTPAGVLRAQALQCLDAGDPLCREGHDAGWLRLRTDQVEPCYGFERIARYEMRPLVDRVPGDVAAATEVAFALSDHVPHGDYQGERGLGYPACPGPVRQGLSPGWAAFRAAGEPGQFIDIDKLNGSFLLSITIDPAGRILEADEGDNTVSLEIRISGNEVEIVEEAAG